MTTEHRYLLALPRGEGRVYLSWRLLSGDPPQAPFVVQRRKPGAAWQMLTAQPLTTTTDFLDRTTLPGPVEYRIRRVDSETVSETVGVDPQAEPTLCALNAPLDPAHQYDDVGLGELTNDGRSGYVLRSRRQGTVWLSAYSYDGQQLWRQNSGLPAAGGWDGSTLHVPVRSWDVNQDGRTEVAFHAFKGRFPGERYDRGGVEGEVLRVVDGESGQLVWEVPWPAIKARVMMTVGHLRGQDQPASIVVLDETYGDVVLTAINGRNGMVDWRVEQARGAGHNLDIADIDRDGVQEVICGGICYNGNGTIRWQAEPFGHTDISKPAKIVPELPGLQIWYAVEKDNPGVYLVDKQGRTMFKEPFRHAHYGWLARHAPGVPGLHPHTAEDARHEYGAAGAGMREEGHFPIFLPDGSHWLNLTDWQRKNFVPVHWAEDSEAVFIIRKENQRLVRLSSSGEIEDLPQGKLPETAQYRRNLARADVRGDYRENIITVDSSGPNLIVLANPNPLQGRGYSPYRDFDYRHDRSQHGSGYYIYVSPPETSVT